MHTTFTSTIVVSYIYLLELRRRGITDEMIHSQPANEIDEVRGCGAMPDISERVAAAPVIFTLLVAISHLTLYINI